MTLEVEVNASTTLTRSGTADPDSIDFSRQLSDPYVFPSAEELVELASRVACDSRLDKFRLSPDPGGRTYIHLIGTPSYEVWLIAWAPSGALQLHDHGGSAGALYVVSGLLIEEFTDFRTSRPLRSQLLGAGNSRSVPADRIHAVWNPGPAPALSVHAYSPPLSGMSFFDNRFEHFLEPLRTEGFEIRSSTGGLLLGGDPRPGTADQQ